uniref:UPAR/Ly6 domain-containing protein n=1 Tax=Chelydra serpentina TaxID=8475 RepID=A0A8C3TCA9_CHESE
MKVSLAVCILAALLATGTCLQCESCQGEGSSCRGDQRTCPAGQDFCSVVLTELTLVAEKTQTILKGCATSKQCQAGPISTNFGKGLRTRTNIACCQRDNCTPEPVKVPPADTKPNGRRCPACYSLTSEQCREETIQCTGAETQCMDIAGPLKSGGRTTKIIMKGCVTESVCTQINAGSGTFLGITGDLPTHKCRAASSAAGSAPGPAGLLPAALAGLLLLTLLS